MIINYLYISTALRISPGGACTLDSFRTPLEAASERSSDAIDSVNIGKQMIAIDPG
jgi:hypothetical protein